MNEDRNMSSSKNITATVDKAYHNFYGSKGMAAPPVSSAGIFNDPEWNEWAERSL